MKRKPETIIEKFILNRVNQIYIVKINSFWFINKILEKTDIVVYIVEYIRSLIYSLLFNLKHLHELKRNFDSFKVKIYMNLIQSHF